MHPRTAAPLRRFGLPLAVIVAIVAIAVVCPSGAAMLSPALAILALLAFGLFRPERLVARLHRRLRRARVAAPQQLARIAPWIPGRAGVARAFALAMRPPPGARSHASA
jgi:hypothetical protein